MTTELSFDREGVDVVYRETEFRLKQELIENATEKPYHDVTDHEILQIIESNPDLDDEPRRIGDIL